jgi:hypothetical protein
MQSLLTNKKKDNATTLKFSDSYLVAPYEYIKKDNANTLKFLSDIYFFMLLLS